MSTPVVDPSLGEILSKLLSQPPTLVVTIIQFVLGFAVGYLSVKVMKYILAFIAVLILGALLSIWSLGTSPSEVLGLFGMISETVKKLAIVVGLMSVGPTTVGFIIGVVIGLLRK